MPIRDQADQHALNQIILTDDHSPDLLFERLYEDARLFYLLMNGFYALVHRILHGVLLRTLCEYFYSEKGLSVKSPPTRPLIQYRGYEKENSLLRYNRFEA